MSPDPQAPDHNCELRVAELPNEEFECEICGAKWWSDARGYDRDRERYILEWRRFGE